MFEEVDPFNEEITVSFQRHKHIQHILLLDNLFHPEKSSIMVGVVEERDDVGAGGGAARLALELERGEAGDGEARRAFEFGRFGVSTQQSVQFPAHALQQTGGAG